MLVDSHAHLQWPSFDRDRKKVITRAREADVKHIVNIGYDLAKTYWRINFSRNRSPETRCSQRLSPALSQQQAKSKAQKASYTSSARSLEALFSSGSQELSYRIAHKAASLLGDDENQRAQIFNDIREIYDERSQIVHGARA
jgi:Tat protein secretion system quality control protein TatD with DNase activity